MMTIEEFEKITGQKYEPDEEMSVDGYLDLYRKVVRLSSDIYNRATVSSVAVAAHECGHAIQDKENYMFMRIRSLLAPVVNFMTYIGYFGLVVSLFAGITGYLKISICLVVLSLLFQLVTLPVEFDASRRALKEIDKQSFLINAEKDLSKQVLKAAALTYVASLISTIIDLLRLVIMLNDRD